MSVLLALAMLAAPLVILTSGPLPASSAPHLAPRLAHSPGNERQPADGRESLEDLLRRLRQERDSYLAKLDGRLKSVIQDLEQAVSPRNQAAIDEARGRLIELGPESSPLLVRYVGSAPGDTKGGRRARVVAGVLAHLGPDSVLEPLFALLRSERSTSIQNALVALSTSHAPEAVGAVVREILPGANDRVREACLRTLATLGGPKNIAVVTNALQDSDEDLVDTALRALAGAGGTDSADEVLTHVTRLPGRAENHIESLIYFYRTVPDIMDERHLDALLDLASSSELTVTRRAAVLELLTRFVGEFNSGTKKRLKKLSLLPRREVAKPALVLLALYGDTRAKRDLLKPVDDTIDKNRNWYQAYVRRAELLYSINDMSGAIRDFKRALGLAEKNPNSDTTEIYIGLARAYASKGRLKDAANILELGPITLVRLRALASEEVFAELREHSQYGKVFR